MRLTRKLPEIPPTLQELLDPQPQILQCDLVEYLRAKEALDEAREQVRTLGGLILEKLMLKRPLQPGPLIARVVDGKLAVDWGRRT